MDAEQRKLIDAVNLLAEYTSKHLPEGWEITLHFTRGEAWCDLTTPDGDDVDVPTAEANYSTIAEMCDTAIYIDSGEPE